MKATGDGQDKMVLPEVTEEDIQEIERRWDMAFDLPRRAILRSNDSFDVLACPGSGKTTLLVAKLAILAKKWPHSRRGICVLSHTNVAQQELEGKILGAGGGEGLLNYPHFIGTIHGFFNTFLALPLLRSEGRPLRLIDDDFCFSWIKRFLLSKPTRFGLGGLVHQERTLDSYIHGLVCGGNPDSMEAPAGMDEKIWRTLKSAKRAAIARGFYYHADMFAFAERLLDSHPEAIELARWRFPAFFTDEMQDTSEAQSRVLARIFPLEKCAIRQRFGDSNQAIYDHGQIQASTDIFPGSQVREIANSQRFDSSIALKAGPLAARQQQLIGDGPPQARRFRTTVDQSAIPHTVFLFGPDTVRDVLPAFAQLLLDIFPAETLRSERFLARAIGRIGKPGGRADDKSGNFPRGLSDYWPGYESEAAKRDPRPESLADFIHLAQRQRASMDCAPAVTTATRGILELLSRTSPTLNCGTLQNLRNLREALREHPQSLRILEHLLWQWCVEARPLQETEWIEQLKRLRTALAPLLQDRKEPDATEFCRWSAVFAASASNGVSEGCRLPNRYRFPEKEPMVEIDVGTIHSAKGQTHTATLVVETFFHDHDIEDLLEWLIGGKFGAEKKCGSRRLERMKFIYTALTRPSHLLCLAMREQAVAKAQNMSASIEAFRSRGWEVKLL